MFSRISKSEFIAEFAAYGREDQFSYDAKGALFDYLEEMEGETGTPIELDIIALCCEFSEYADIEEFRADYGDEYENIDDIEQNTIVIRFGADSFLIAAF